jgi:hypothetical protein
MKGWELEDFERYLDEAKQDIERHDSVPCHYGCNGLARCSAQQNNYRHLWEMQRRHDYVKEHGSTAGMVCY